jgi:transmembrane sensor
MSDVASRFRRAAKTVEPPWPTAREDAIAEAIERAHARRIRKGRALAAAVPLALAAAVALVVVVTRGPSSGDDALASMHGAAEAPEAPGPSGAQTASPEPRRLVRLEDGSTAAFSGDAIYTVRRASGSGTLVVELAEGAAHFDVVPDASRTFEVHAAAVIVRVVGTSFHVERKDGLVRVAVEHGRVEVESGSRRALLGPGDVWSSRATSSGADAGELTVAPLATGGPPLASRESPATDGVRPGRAQPRDWRTLAREHDYDQAYEALSRSGPRTVRSDPEELLLAADVARLSRHPAEAVRPLERLLAEHAGDPRAPLAAFTLGRVQLDALGRPREAAAAFARARSLDPHGQLAEDALAREVESWSRAGEVVRARERATEYVTRYPAGRRREAVRRHGGID